MDKEKNTSDKQNREWWPAIFLTSKTFNCLNQLSYKKFTQKI